MSFERDLSRAAGVPYGPRGTAVLASALAAIAALGPSAAVVGAQAIPAHGGSVAEGSDFVVYDRAGNRASLADVQRHAAGAEVLLVGEEHGDLTGHAVEAELLREALAARGPEGVVLSLEMFERDVQYVVDEYLAGLVTEAHFLRSARPWDDYEIRYRPLVEAAREVGAPVVAANAPRRYVNRVSREGPESLDALSDLARSFLPPLPFPGPSETYRAQWDALMADAMSGTAGASDAGSADGADTPPAHATEDAGGASGPAHGIPEGAIQAQALWDAAMGHAITTALVDHLGALVVHYAGSFHVARGTGIPERIDDYRPGTRIATVVLTAVDDVEAWSEDDHAGLADFVVLTRRAEEGDEPVSPPRRSGS